VGSKNQTSCGNGDGENSRCQNTVASERYCSFCSDGEKANAKQVAARFYRS
jgi:hypothetical protein